MSYNPSPFIELIKKEIEKSGAFEDSEDKRKELSEAIDDKLFTIMKIIVNDDQVEKLKEFNDYHYYFLHAILDATSRLDDEERVNLFFSITNALLCMSVPMMVSPSGEDDVGKIVNNYNKRINRIKRHVNFCITLITNDREKGKEIDRDFVIKHLSRYIDLKED